MDKTGAHLEIEKKLIIAYPDLRRITEYPGAVRYEIEQIYFPERDGVSERIRRRAGRSGVEYFYTTKRRLTDMTRVEDEREIGEDEYYRLKASAQNVCSIAACGASEISKTRFCLPCGGHVAEIDIFPFWREIAYAEVELSREDEEASLPAFIPEFIRVIRDATSDSRFTNRRLAETMARGGVAAVKELEREVTGWKKE